MSSNYMIDCRDSWSVHNWPDHPSCFTDRDPGDQIARSPHVPSRQGADRVPPISWVAVVPSWAPCSVGASSPGSPPVVTVLPQAHCALGRSH